MNYLGYLYHAAYMLGSFLHGKSFVFLTFLHLGFLFFFFNLDSQNSGTLNNLMQVHKANKQHMWAPGVCSSLCGCITTPSQIILGLILVRNKKQETMLFLK